MNDASLLFRSAPTQHSMGLLEPFFSSVELMPFGYDNELLANTLKALQTGDMQGFFDGIDIMLPTEVTCDTIRVSANHMRFVLIDNSRRRHPGDVYEISHLTEMAFSDIKDALLDLMRNGRLEDLGDGLYTIDRHFEMGNIAT